VGGNVGITVVNYLTFADDTCVFGLSIRGLQCLPNYLWWLCY